jgi:Mannosyl-glycoprotein endo-beta-N-acetylglucosaminidase
MHGRQVTAVLVGLALLGAVVAPARPVYAGASYATVASSSPLTVRGGPGTGYPRLRSLARNTRTTPTCQHTGTRIRGSVRTTNLWDRLAGGGFVADAYLRWHPARPKLPTCATPPPPDLPPPGTPMSHQQFIAAVAGPAQGTARRYQVPASVTLAQAILESGWGASGLAAADHNYFGIKCFNGVPGPIATGCHAYTTHECGAGTCWPTVASFRVYRSLGDSVADHGRFLVVNDRYRPAFAYRNDPDQFAVELQRAGYATSPTYAQNLQSLMRQYDLYRHDIHIP